MSPLDPLENVRPPTAVAASEPRAQAPLTATSPAVADQPGLTLPLRNGAATAFRPAAEPTRPLALAFDAGFGQIADLQPFAASPLPEATGLSQPAAAFAPAALARAEQIAAQITAQMASLSGIADRAAPLEIALDPPELGRLRISVAIGEDGMVLNVAIDRPETLDLMRRYAGLLNQEFQRQGLENADFSFSGRDDDPPTSPRPGQDGAGHAPGESQSEEHGAANAHNLDATGLDIRI